MQVTQFKRTWTEPNRQIGWLCSSAESWQIVLEDFRRQLPSITEVEIECCSAVISLCCQCLLIIYAVAVDRQMKSKAAATKQQQQQPEEEKEEDQLEEETEDKESNAEAKETDEAE